ncbi:MAG: hypothetical protein Q7R41_07760 [Phycisphaerales bacterium]|nr:hypothetical protein [Phycisphaerales bacterium]
MSKQRIIKQCTAVAHAVDPNWSRWLSMVRELPEIRADKVRRTRDAIAANNFDADAVLDAAIDRLRNDLGVLSRREDDPDENAAAAGA